jgi:hypothetical protein
MFKVVQAFLKLMDTASKPVYCVLCGPYPKFLGFDGVSLAMSKSNINWETVETIFLKSATTVPPEQETLKHKHWVLLPKKSRVLLLQYCTSNPTSLDKLGYDKLVQLISKHLPSLQPVLELLHNIELQKMQKVQLGFFNHLLSEKSCFLPLLLLPQLCGYLDQQSFLLYCI